jgi:hypothetical protein
MTLPTDVLSNTVVAKFYIHSLRLHPVGMYVLLDVFKHQGMGRKRLMA